MPPYTDVDNDYQTLAINANKFDRYRIRPMSESDIDTVVKIDQVTWGDESWPSNDFFRAVDNPFWNCWILENTTNDHSIIGYGLQYGLDNVSHIANLTLRPNQCGRGLGGILLRHMINHARQNGAVNITLEVNTSNTRALNLYVKHGFTVIELVKQYYLNNADAFRMELILCTVSSQLSNYL